MTAGSCPSPGLSRALAVGVIGCGWAASQSMRCPLAYHLPQAAIARPGWVLCPFLGAPSVQAVRSRSSKMKPRGSQLAVVDALFFSVWEFESNTVRQWNRTPRGAVRD